MAEIIKRSTKDQQL